MIRHAAAILWLFIWRKADTPDVYPLRAEDGREYWILSGAHDKYYVGIFDEEGYYSPVQEIGQLSYDSEGYAAQTYFYEKEKPVIRFTWDRSNIPGTPYNGSMCFPMEMGLVKRDGTFYLTARPVSYEAGLVKKRLLFSRGRKPQKDRTLFPDLQVVELVCLRFLQNAEGFQAVQAKPHGGDQTGKEKL